MPLLLELKNFPKGKQEAGGRPSILLCSAWSRTHSFGAPNITTKGVIGESRKTEYLSPGLVLSCVLYELPLLLMFPASVSVSTSAISRSSTDDKASGEISHGKAVGNKEASVREAAETAV